MVDNRRFHYAIAASLALHAAVLFTFEKPDRARALRFPPPIIARLMAPEPVAPDPVAPTPAAPVEHPQAAPVKKPPVPKAARTPPKPIPAPIVEPESVAGPSAQGGEEKPIAAEAPAVSPSIAALPAQPALPAQSAPAAPAGPVFDMRSRTEYRIDLIGEAGRIKQNKPYPPQAYENHWEGEVLLSVVVAANGRSSITVRRSSQYEVLDRHAVEIYRDAARSMSIPPALRGKEFAFEVEVVYKR